MSRNELQRAVRLFSVAMAVVVSTSELGAQDIEARSFGDRVSDLATLSDGTKLRGIAASKKPTVIMLRTAWLEMNEPKFLNELLPLVKALPVSTDGELLKLIGDEIVRLEAEDTRDQRRIGLLKEIVRAREPEEGVLPALLLVEIPRDRLKRFDLQPESRRKTAQLAALNAIEGYEDLSTKSVEAKLAEFGPALKRELPRSTGAPERELRAILAAVDVQLGTVSRLVRHGSSVFDESARPDAGELLQQVLGGGLEQTLGDLLSEGGATPEAAANDETLPDAAINLADKAKLSSIVLSSFRTDLASGTAEVSRFLYTKDADGQWIRQPVLSTSSTASANDLKAGEADAIAADPQVKQITDAVAAFGIDDQQLSTALSMGAIVQSALRKADAAFQEQLLRITDTPAGNTQAPPRVVLPR